MTALALSLGYVGWAALSFAMMSHHRALTSKAPSKILVVVLRLLGAAALLGALLVCADRWGWPRGSIAWFGVLSVSGLILIVLLAVRHRLALAVAIGLPIINVGAVLLPAWH